MSGHQKRVLVSAGEVSGDLHGALLAEVLLKEKDFLLYGLGGPKMQQAGVDILFDIRKHSSVGFTAFYRHLFSLLKTFSKLKKRILDNPPDMALLIDNQGFNIKLAGWLSKRKIKTLYYFPPPVSIWGRWNAAKLAPIVSKLICPFQHDAEIYKEAGANAVFSGHPFVDTVMTTKSKDESFSEYGFNAKQKLIILLPGSREQEINTLIQPLLKSAKALSLTTSYQFVLPIGHEKYKDIIKHKLEDFPDLNIKAIDNFDYNLMSYAELAIASSGTATLELALLGVPSVIVYKVSAITYFVGKRLVKDKLIGLPNIVYGEKIFPELLQKEVNPDTIVFHARHFLEHPETQAALKLKMEKIKSNLGQSGALDRIKEFILNEL